MPTTDDRDDPRIDTPRPDGQNEAYLVLDEEERAKGWVRPLRLTYVHRGIRPTHPTRALTDDELKRYDGLGYAVFEEYPESESPKTGRFWTLSQMQSGCDRTTSMGSKIAETYARDPSFYGATFCVSCGEHLPVAEFEWIETDGTNQGNRLGS